MYFWKSLRGLAQPCRGAARITPAGRTQLARIASGRFPKCGPWHVSELEAIDVDTVDAAREQLSHMRGGVRPIVDFVERWAQPDSEEILRSFGAAVEDLEELRLLAAVERTARAGPSDGEGPGEEHFLGGPELEEEEDEAIW